MVLIGLREVMTMSNLKYCQGTRCHTYDTKDRKKGSKGNKRNETRKRTSFYYGNGNFCSLNCQKKLLRSDFEGITDEGRRFIVRLQNSNVHI